MSDDETSVPAVRNILDLETEGTELAVAVETQSTGWKVNRPSVTVNDPSILKLHLTNPPVERIDLRFPLGQAVTARNIMGVTFKDALDAIHKAFRKRSDEQLDKSYLAGFEWDREEEWTRLNVHLASSPALTRA